MCKKHCLIGFVAAVLVSGLAAVNGFATETDNENVKMQTYSKEEVIAVEKSSTGASLGVDVVAGPDTCGAPGDTVPGIFTIINKGTVVDSYYCRTYSMLDWSVYPSEFQLTLDPEQDTSVVIDVYIPTEAEPGDTSMIILGAISLTFDCAHDKDSLIVFQQVQLPNTVYVFNHVTKENAEAGDNNAEGYVWKQLGLLDANGKPGTIKENGEIVDGQGKVLGYVIKDANGEVIGYRSKDGAKEAYDVNSTAKTSNAWKRVAKNGTLHIVKHGYSYWDAIDRIRRYGGGIILDTGKVFGGFGKGTGAPAPGEQGKDLPAYDLAPRPGDNITVILSACWSSKDPNEDDDDITSVTQSATTVPGIRAVQGYQTKADPSVGPILTAEAWKALIAAAAKDGYIKEGMTEKKKQDAAVQWIADQPFVEQYKKLQEAIQGTGTTAKLDYGLKPGAPKGDTIFAGYHHCPILFTPEIDCTTEYFPDWSSIFLARIELPSGALSTPTIFHLRQLAELPESLPQGWRLASGVFDFRHLEYEPNLLSPALVTLAYFGDKNLIQMFRFDESLDDWVPADGNPIGDTANQTLTVDTYTIGIFAIFEQLVYTLRVVDIRGALGTSSNSMDIELVNPMSVGGVQFTLTFDSSLLTLDSATTTSRTSHMGIASNIWADSGMVLLYSVSGDSILSDGDPIVKAFFSVDAIATAGDSTLVELKDATLTDPTANPISVTTEDGWLFLGLKGDLNGDGLVNIVDLQRLINCILHRPPPCTDYEKWAGDVAPTPNGDGVLNIADVVKLIRMILGLPLKSPAKRVRLGSAKVHIGEALSPKDEWTIIPIEMETPMPVAGIQMTLKYDSNAITVGEPQITELSKGFETDYAVKSGEMKILMYSLSGDLMPVGSDPIIIIPVKITPTSTENNLLQLKDIIISTANSNTVPVLTEDTSIRTFTLPKICALSQNYPNPFTNATSIRYQLPVGSDVCLRIYSFTGQLVRTLVNAKKEAGYYNVVWDGRDDSGKKVTSGIYFYKIQTHTGLGIPDYTETKKLILLR
jgi:hypothetical protein